MFPATIMARNQRPREGSFSASSQYGTVRLRPSSFVACMQASALRMSASLARLVSLFALQKVCELGAADAADTWRGGGAVHNHAISE